MAFEIAISAEANLDIKEIREYYFDVSSKILKKFNAELIQSIEKISSNPEKFQKRYQQIKIVFIEKFPFYIHYLTSSNTVFVQRVLHRKQFS